MRDFRGLSAVSFNRNGEREVSIPDRYGFEIVHGRPRSRHGAKHHPKQNIRSSIENLRQIKPFKFYTVVEPEIYPHLIRRMVIARLNRDGAERFKTDEAIPVKSIDGV